MISAYYHERGWTSDGRVPDGLRDELGIGEKAFGSVEASCLEPQRS
jgi:hypothetical protein